MVSFNPLLSRNNTCKLNCVVDHVVELIELAIQPSIKQYLVLAGEGRASRRKNLRALFEVVDVVHT